MNPIKGFPGAAVVDDAPPARSDCMDPAVMRAKGMYDQYLREDGTLESRMYSMKMEMKMGEGPRDMD